MPELSRSEIAAYAACAVLVALLGWRVLRADGSAGSASAGSSAGVRAASTTAPSGSVSVTSPAADASVTVHVVGAVRRAGVFRLRQGQRVQDAIRRAGGASGGADLQAINLAAKVADGQQVVVPRKAAAVGAGATPGVAAAPGASAPAAGSGSAGAVASAPVSLNTATLDQLDTLPGVGPATAQKILDYRQAHGGFASIDDLAQVPGIGPKRLETLRPEVTV